jgi:hypothetical protein
LRILLRSLKTIINNTSNIPKIHTKSGVSLQGERLQGKNCLLAFGQWGPSVPYLFVCGFGIG